MAKPKPKALDPVAGFDNPVKKQEDLPGMENRGIPEIEEAARKYGAIRDRRMVLNKQEADTKALLLALLKKHDLRGYNHDGVEAEIVPEGETVKVRIKEASEEEVHGVRDKANTRGKNRTHRGPDRKSQGAGEKVNSASGETGEETGTATEATDGEGIPF